MPGTGGGAWGWAQLDCVTLLRSQYSRCRQRLSLYLLNTRSAMLALEETVDTVPVPG